MEQKKIFIPYPLFLVDECIEKIANQSIPTLLFSRFKESCVEMKKMKKEDCPHSFLCEKYPLKQYPVELTFDQNLKVEELREIWSKFVDLKEPGFLSDSLEPLKVNSVESPFILIHDCMTKKFDTDAINHFISKIELLSRNSDLNICNPEKILLNELAENYTIILDHKKISEKFTNIYFSFFNQTTKNIPESVKRNIVDHCKDILKRICKTLIFRFIKPNRTQSLRDFNYLQIDGSNMITNNPLMTLFFVFAFAPKSFSMKPYLGSTSFKAIHNCIKSILNEKKTYPVYNYFILLKSHPIPRSNQNYTFGDFELPKHMTYTMQNRIKMLLESKSEDNDLFKAQKEKTQILKAKKEALKPEEYQFQNSFSAIREKIRSEWNTSFFIVSSPDGQKKPFRMNNIYHLYKTHNLKKDFLTNQTAFYNGIVMIDFAWIVKCIPKEKQKPAKKDGLDDDHHMPKKKYDDHDTNKKQTLKDDRNHSESSTSRPKHAPTIIEKKPNTDSPQIPEIQLQHLKKEIFQRIDEKFSQMFSDISKTILKGFSEQQQTIAHEVKTNFERIRSQELEDVLTIFSDIHLTDQNPLNIDITPKKTKKRNISQISPIIASLDEENIPYIDPLFGDLTRDYSDADATTEGEELSIVEYSEEEEDEGSVDLCESSDEKTKKKRKPRQKAPKMTSSSSSSNESSLIQSMIQTPDSRVFQKSIYSKFPINSQNYRTIVIENWDIYNVRHHNENEKIRKNLIFDEEKFNLLLPILVCFIGDQYCISQLNFVLPTGYLGEEFYIDFDKENQETNPFFIPETQKIDVTMLEKYLSLRQIITSNKSNRSKLLIELQKFFERNQQFSNIIEKYPSSREYLICHSCRTEGDETFQTSYCNVDNPDYDEKTNYEIYKCLKEVSPAPIKEDMFSKVEWCYNCNNGFYSNMTKNRPEYFCLSPPFSCIPDHILKELYVNSEKLNVLLHIPVVSSKRGAAFCSDECCKIFVAFNRKLQNLIKKLRE